MDVSSNAEPILLKLTSVKSSNLKGVLRVKILNVQQRSAGTNAAPAAFASSRRFSPAKILRSVCFSISTTLLIANHPQLTAQQVTTVAPPSGADAEALPNAPGVPQYPDAVPLPSEDQGSVAHIETAPDGRQSFQGSVAILDKDVVITYGDHTLRADHIEFDKATGNVTMTGHLLVTGGENSERIEASHGTFNVNTQTGRFYDVSGSVGLLRNPQPGTSVRAVYANSNPFLFTGRMVVKTGPREYDIYGGTVTSCQLEHPDWLLSAGDFRLDDKHAVAHNSVFHLKSLPILWLPYVTHPVDAITRETGILIPDIGFNSASKGTTIGEQVYWAINRSMDLTVGSIYYSARGYEETGSFRYRGLGQDFIKSHFSSLQDRGYTPVGGTYTNQSGTDVLFSGRHDLYINPEDYIHTPSSSTVAAVQGRLVADVEYLSSFPYREAFSSNFNQAVSTDVVSTVYGTREWNGLAASLEGDRYQGEKRVPTATLGEQQVHIIHAPAAEFTTTDHHLGATGLEWNLDSSLAALKRSQPNFTTSGMIERLDLHPEIAFPFGGRGWFVRPSLAGRETFYSRSRFAAVVGVTGPPVENTATLNRSDFELQLDIRPPVLERTFDSGIVKKLFRHDVRHTIEPELTYRFVKGINQFPQTLRFDTIDVASDTNEVGYGFTQRLFLRRTGGTPCRAAGSSADADEVLGSAGQDSDAAEDPGQATNRVDAAAPVCGNREWISWRVGQKYFFDHTFGGAVVLNGPRSILQTTLDFSGIAFLTGPRNISPITSRLRVRTSEKADIEWDFDFDLCSAPVSAVSAAAQPCHQKFTANNVYLDLHQSDTGHTRPLFGGISYARLDAPARSYVDGVLSSIADFNQIRVLFGFGKPTRPGLSAAAYTGLDLDLGTVQYGAIQASYNWNCCGISVEYRKYELGTARNDNGYKFNFTLANIGSAGNLRHSDQIF
jgi:LPS-assembly protein